MNVNHAFNFLVGDPMRCVKSFKFNEQRKFTSKGKISVNVQLLNEDNNKVSIQFLITDTRKECLKID
jgi:hypothetical protein